MKVLYYKHIPNDFSYKITILTEDLKFIDKILDTLSPKTTEYLTKEQFENTYNETMVLDIMNEDFSEKIGEIETKYIDVLNDGDII